jgi:uncharacterized protein DUF6285
MQDRPTAHELLSAVWRFLDEEIVPATEGRRQFLARVAANVLRTVDRELEGEERHAAAEWASLDALLGVEVMPQAAAERRSALLRRNQALCERIRGGALDRADGLEPRLLEHVRRTVADKLVVTNPAWLEADAKRAPRG